MSRTIAILVRKKITFFLLLTFVICAIFIIYQLIIYRRLLNIPAVKDNGNTNVQNGALSKGFQSSYFYCTTSQERIDYSQVNDDYCDCLDGSDEPKTSACSNGQFFCSFQKPFNNYPKVIPSNRVNDGICDCCDGSDEWKHQVLPNRLPGKQYCTIVE